MHDTDPRPEVTATIVIPHGAVFPAQTQLPVAKLREALTGGFFYDYTSQEWRPGQDHVHLHIDTDAPAAGRYRILYCAADLDACQPFMAVRKDRVTP
jgi:hypothetical protein